ncbi:MAG: hypothetical protein WCW67_07985 [Candidatus Margulisiibacteriota bacterium]|jgi:hypothetical protein
MFKKLLVLICALLIIALPARAAEVIKASPNYLVILVHGINDDHKIFTGEKDVFVLTKDKIGDFKKWLEDNVGLEGYVYAYDFSENHGKLEKNGMGGGG